ncbi:hypothetical protein LX32DRAFT_316516 [Colletotrichum zoysiae]|uniref:Uncharacterized protein n=1 Tax=Colletotrichum zoysiae TaxID=1216348 RepID=A0AAD9M6Q4_9PEZI|nr:hypothetical protein LX32DRAFT_316516 [Colletotrichum zoysiae]
MRCDADWGGGVCLSECEGEEGAGVALPPSSHVTQTHARYHSLHHSPTRRLSLSLSLPISLSLSLSVALPGQVSHFRRVSVCLSAVWMGGVGSGHWGEGGRGGGCQLVWRKPMSHLVVESTFPDLDGVGESLTPRFRPPARPPARIASPAPHRLFCSIPLRFPASISKQGLCLAGLRWAGLNESPRVNLSFRLPPRMTMSKRVAADDHVGGAGTRS